MLPDPMNDDLKDTTSSSAGSIKPTLDPDVKFLPASYYDRFLSLEAKNRKPSAIRSLFPLENTPGLISLLAGKPNPSTFPFTSLNFTAKNPSNPDQDAGIHLTPADLADGLQYGPTAGIPKLRNWLFGLQGLMHGRKYDNGKQGWTLSVGSGSQDLIFKAVIAMVNPGDSVLVESPVYAGVIPMFQNLHCDQIEVETDSHGIRSESLREILRSWPVDKPKPKILYTVPYGCNPTGMTATLERRKEVLRLAREHEFIILEDDPYFYLYYGDHPRYPSYFSLERGEPEVGRVLRFDSFSKVLSAGIRIGFASGPAPLLNAVDQHTATSNLQTSSLTQVIVYSLLDSWGYDGFKLHFDSVAKLYREKRDIFQKAFEKHLKGLVEWDMPEAGMFFWFKLLVPPSSNESGSGSGSGSSSVTVIEGDSEDVIRTKAFEKGVLALPGTCFLPNGRKTPFVRASFSLTPPEDVERAVQRLREAILESRSDANVSTPAGGQSA